MSNELVCPVDRVMVNESKVRVVAGLVLLLGATFLLTGYWVIVAFLLADFLLRAFNLGVYSILGFFAERLVRLFHLKGKLVDRAPKRFAAGIGVIFTMSILLVTIFQLGLVGMILCVTLMFFAFLESVFSFCAGCYVYSFLQRSKRMFKD